MLVLVGEEKWKVRERRKMKFSIPSATSISHSSPFLLLRLSLLISPLFFTSPLLCSTGASDLFFSFCFRFFFRKSFRLFSMRFFYVSRIQKLDFLRLTRVGEEARAKGRKEARGASRIHDFTGLAKSRTTPRNGRLPQPLFRVFFFLAQKERRAELA